jgi:hypothetical protein
MLGKDRPYVAIEQQRLIGERCARQQQNQNSSSHAAAFAGNCGELEAGVDLVVSSAAGR